ncbi:hypothetical protein Ssi03_76280 [Sphaerisporangium siamense]|uniref:Transcriptional regulator with XRE-family HTH domain n=1 Tax=Sphaerisporangium siamense TaxID=795645 RepID=A0A7W7G696_9ACTN|nr:helix-turn-helix transcriptional regulator [Sphaerisporangium siamense]MBB4699308.1 transcriptional regulator with XRE-family HTH domain [Sphaerisporangium siamense]GII89638.1 hypothetical protein Ssi03_76280 [Sphaerisporangium siamense]
MASRPQIGVVGQHVAGAITRLRHDRGLEQRDLAERVSTAGRPLTASVLSKIESGSRRIDVDDLAAIANALGASPALLLTSTDNEPGLVYGPVADAVRADIEALGDLVGVEPSLAQMACRLAMEIDAGGGEDHRLLSQLNRELRATLAQLLEGRPEKSDDDELDDLADPV